MQVTLTQVWQEVQMLPMEQLEELRGLLAAKLDGPAQMTEEEFERELAAEGFIDEAKPPITDFAPYRDYRPVSVSGPPVSEMILEERR